jgi:hypothetical protein
MWPLSERAWPGSSAVWALAHQQHVCSALKALHQPESPHEPACWGAHAGPQRNADPRPERCPARQRPRSTRCFTRLASLMTTVVVRPIAHLPLTSAPCFAPSARVLTRHIADERRGWDRGRGDGTQEPSQGSKSRRTSSTTRGAVGSFRGRRSAGSPDASGRSPPALVPTQRVLWRSGPEPHIHPDRARDPGGAMGAPARRVRTPPRTRH